MTTFRGGPAEGQILMLRRSPRFLRVVRDKANEFDALDQLGDSAATDEEISVYEKCAPATLIHVKSGKQGASGWYRSAAYQLVTPQPTDAQVRDNTAWRRWAFSAADSRPSLVSQP